MDRESAKEYINRQEPIFLQAAGKRGYICPACNQGANKGQGITRASGRPNLWHCVSCERERSVLGLFALHTGIEDSPEHFPQILEQAAEYYGIKLDDGSQQYTHNSIHTNTPAQKDTAIQQDFTSFYREAAAQLGGTDYPQQRGFSQETCKKYGLGFAPAWKHPKRPNMEASPRLIIPISKNNYLARDTRGDLTEQQDKDKKMLCKGADSVSWTWNRQALQTSDKPVFVVESITDALSIIECGGEAVAISSTAYINRFVKELQEEPPTQPLIITLDNDNAGENAAAKLEEQLEQLGIPFYRGNPAGDYKDANDRLIADRAGLAAAVEQACNSVEEKQEEADQERRDAYMQNCTAAHLQEFVDGIKASVNTPYISTGFKRLDDTLDGGLHEGLHIIGAISSLGKTSLVLQMADQMAQLGQHVLIFSLEMARSELMAKSISRHTLQEVLATQGNMDDAKTTRGITTGRLYQRYSQKEKDLINKAVAAYGRYAPLVYVVEGMGDIGITQVRDTVQEHISITGQKPVVIIDYLQLLAPYNERATDKQNTDKAVLELKRISRDYKLPVIAISSFNRKNYRAAVAMDAFKESGAIEYSADILIGLQLAGAGNEGFNETTAKQADPREIELVILKNRNGKTGDTLEYDYYCKFNYFTEV